VMSRRVNSLKSVPLFTSTLPCGCSTSTCGHVRRRTDA
jgi:hypothetical protein